jgi:syntaxin 16
MQRLDRAEAVNIERDQEVTKILQSVNDLAGVMKDLSVLVIDQGTILDRIDYNCEQVEITVDEGRKQLVKAETHQKSARMITCIYFLMVMIGLMTMVVIFQKM